MSQLIRVVIVDDSLLMQRVITSLIQQDPTIKVVGTASNGQEAIALIEQLRPDVVTMDVRMPIMDGLETTKHVMAYCPTPILVLTASLARHDVDITFKMLGAGALDVVEKPSGKDPQTLARAGQDLIRRIKLLSRVKVVTHLRGRRKPGESSAEPVTRERIVSTSSYTHITSPAKRTTAEPLPNGAARTGFPVIVIGASTGGPRIVNQIISALPEDLPAALIVVQHIAPGFSSGMAEWLATNSRLPVRVADEGALIKSGEVMIVPDRCDLLLSKDGRVHLSRSSILLQRPSVDVAMQSTVDVFGRRVIGVLLTGMGRDGAYGMLTVRKAGGHTIAQDEATSAIFGMPRAAIELGAAAEVLPANTIAGRLIALVAEAPRAIRV
jgi:two-component system chemotaxis response regulator CheB